MFSLDKNEMGCTDATEHVIKLTKSEPFKERFRRIAPPLVEEVREHIQEMLDGGAIRPSNSPWCNAIVLVRKKDGTLRFCIDFRRLNNRMEKDSFPMPKMVDTMETMVGARIFSTMDLKSGFWQVKMAEESRPYTAFTVGSLGVYEFLRMPFGLCNAPANVSTSHAKLSRQVKPHVCSHLPRRHRRLLRHREGACEASRSSIRALP